MLPRRLKGPQAAAVALDLSSFGVDLVLFSDFRSRTPELRRDATATNYSWSTTS